MPILCCRCQSKGYIKRPKTGHIMCKECFSWCFEEEVHWTIVHSKLITPGDKIAIGASGGKDSTVLAYILNLLNKRYGYGAELLLLSIDEGISGYRDDSLLTVKRNQVQYVLPLKILSYQELYGWSMDDIVKRIGNKRNCTYCGIFRRQALDKGALLLGANKICTGHNADDIAETVLMNSMFEFCRNTHFILLKLLNVLRGDIGRLKRCTAIMTGTDDILPRFKPFKYAYEKEIVMYAHMHKLDYFSTECKYAPQAYRGHVRSFIKELERIRPRTIIDIIASGERMAIRSDVKMPQKSACRKCGCISSQPICQACILLAQLNSGLPQITVKDTDYHTEVN
ncbi:hypothetical protein MN116_002869 [Schistosoma mekongi]|uniref:Cytoplasmic tRNA 2-thiolation protein 1 n=1 Tax=Schistosoma mekongi TaxID=38744 RepID=A0AAE1ZGR8_SCHME|nr:hypothetical protein MN116_002869 [Schistosoma mekongi]